MGDCVLTKPLDLLDTEGVAADPVDLLEVQRAPLPSARRMHSHAHLERLGLAHGVVDDVDRTRICHWQALQRLTQSTATPCNQFLDDRQARFVVEHEVCAEPAGQCRLRVEAGDDGDLRIEGPEVPRRRTAPATLPNAVARHVPQAV